MARVLDIAGAVFLANAGWMLFQRVTARNVTRGTVVGYEETRSTSMEPGTDETIFYQPIVEFTDWQGRTQRFTAVGGSTRREPSRGTRVPVRYRRADRSQAWIGTFANTWVMPIVWTAIGATLLALARR